MHEMNVQLEERLHTIEAISDGSLPEGLEITKSGEIKGIPEICNFSDYNSSY